LFKRHIVRLQKFNIQRVQWGSVRKLSIFLKFLIGQRGLGKPVEKATFSSLEARSILAAPSTQFSTQYVDMQIERRRGKKKKDSWKTTMAVFDKVRPTFFILNSLKLEGLQKNRIFAKFL
jgi:hypothetical protein